MKLSDARVTLVTLGVADLERARRFYEALGWRTSEAGNDTIVFLQGEGIALALFGRAALAEDAGLAAPDALPDFRGLSLAVNLSSRAQVDRLFATALEAGGRALKAPQAVFWGGYSSYVADPDGHLWEFAHNPMLALDEAGHPDLFAPATPPAAGATS